MTNAPLYTLAEGRPVADPASAQHFGGQGIKGLVLLQDTQLIETLAHFSRERIPERVVHASAVGAFGEFEVTHDVTDITSAAFLSKIGKKSKCLLRVSTVGPEAGGADTVRDVRGWGMKIYTEEGNQDFVFNDIPVFFIRDPIKFPSVNRSHKRHPRTHLGDWSMFWDFHNTNQEGIHALMILFSDRGTPASIRNINSYSGHTYKLVKDDGSFKYVKFHFKTNQGIKNLTRSEATKLAGENPDAHLQDLHDSIEHGDFPSWTLYVQVMDPADAETYRWNIFDMTKVWPQKDYPLRPVGKLTLNENPSNYFRDIEQAAFSPSNMVPGIAPSADPMLQARMFAYPDAARYRLGVNYQTLPPNAAKSPVYSPYQRDGAMVFGSNYGGDPNYVRSTQKEVAFRKTATIAKGNPHEKWVGEVSDFSSEVTDEDFVQARDLWKVLGRQEGQQENLVGNVAATLSQAVPEVQKETFAMFRRVDEELGRKIEAAT
ncbi:catalase-domain-containing protein [Mytilinidion resinicola]|uniref:Catalase-domain-containing protein n=1 Tax=Mytilinidion resinicola TaxID=574789 RepID=A0A6A6YDZ3_9PEZI|nr:catalase-domain-containing protein [Mytilinidion resinicola]KAF2807036.1 catalase-domain-containing protein [Mytilinidion resinicola]